MGAEQFDNVYGINAVSAMLEHNPSRVLELIVGRERSDRRMATLRELAERRGVRVRVVESAELDAMLEDGGQPAHQQVFARCRPAQLMDERYLASLLEQLQGNALLLILDGVTDPHNLGACLRSANAAGAHAVIVPRDKAVHLTPVVRKVASGAAELTPLVVVKNLARCIESLQKSGVWVMGAAADAAQSVYQLDLKVNTALVLGAEGAGLRRLTRERCDALFAIPMAGQVESLNVSVAAGVCLFEALRQRSS